VTKEEKYRYIINFTKCPYCVLGILVCLRTLVHLDALISLRYFVGPNFTVQRILLKRYFERVCFISVYIPQI